MLFSLRIGKRPFYKAHKSDPYFKAFSKEKKRHKFWKAFAKNRPKDFIDEDFKDLMVNFFEIDPDLRISLAEIKQHPWFLRKVASKEKV